MRAWTSVYDGPAMIPEVSNSCCGISSQSPMASESSNRPTSSDRWRRVRSVMNTPRPMRSPRLPASAYAAAVVISASSAIANSKPLRERQERPLEQVVRDVAPQHGVDLPERHGLGVRQVAAPSRRGVPGQHQRQQARHQPHDRAQAPRLQRNRARPLGRDHDDVAEGNGAEGDEEVEGEECRPRAGTRRCPWPSGRSAT